MAGSFRDLTVYKKAFALAIEIFEITKIFPLLNHMVENPEKYRPKH